MQEGNCHKANKMQMRRICSTAHLHHLICKTEDETIEKNQEVTYMHQNCWGVPTADASQKGASAAERLH